VDANGAGNVVGGVHLRMFATPRTAPHVGSQSFMTTVGVLETVNVPFRYLLGHAALP
jgi:hypothetical protein